MFICSAKIVLTTWNSSKCSSLDKLLTSLYVCFASCKKASISRRHVSIACCALLHIHNLLTKDAQHKSMVMSKEMTALSEFIALQDINALEETISE